MRVAVIGASGFVGRHLVAHLAAARVEGIAINRRFDSAAASAAPPPRIVPEYAGDSALRAALAGVDTAIHLVARVHQRRESDPRARDAYWRVNHQLALRWARAAVAAGVRRFVFVSSVKAVAETSAHPLDESCLPAPEDDYGRSKRAAEIDLMVDPALAGLERVIVRPPLVYGPGVGANFLRLMRIAAGPWPLPLAGARAPRSMISVANLADALLVCALSPVAAGRTYFVADAEDLSAARLIAELRGLQGRKAGLFRVPLPLLRALAAAAGQSEQLRRLFETLQVDSARIRSELGWSPPQSTGTGLAAVAEWFNATRRGQGRPG